MQKKFILVWVSVMMFLLSSGLCSAAPMETIKADESVTAAVGNFLKKAPDMSFYRFTLKAVNGVLQTGSPEYVILDVRDKEDFVVEHIPTAINVPLAMIPDKLGAIPLNKPIYVIAAVDCDSAYATFALRLLGYHAYMIPGGEPAWKEAGFQLVSGAK